MILARRQIVDRSFYGFEIELLAADDHLTFAEPVFQVAIAQIKRMIGGRDPRGVRIPMQEIEGRRLLALEIVVDDVRPDQIIRAQQVERGRHFSAFEIAALLHFALPRGYLLLIDEHFEIAGMGKIDLRSKQGGGNDAAIARARYVGEGGREQRASNAIAE